MLTAGQLTANLEKVRHRVDDACRRANRNPADVTLLAVSKLQPAAALRDIAMAGQMDFGENYVQEAMQKMADLADLNLCWHMTGHVQSRKAGDVAGRFALIHTLDSQKLAAALERHLVGKNLLQNVLIEVNIAQEPQKGGIDPDHLQELGEYVLANCPHLALRGVMCLPPVFDNGEAARPWFKKLRELRSDLAKGLDMDLPVLSIGMSGDFEAAIAEGATIIRIGTAIFGPRAVKK